MGDVTNPALAEGGAGPSPFDTVSGAGLTGFESSIEEIDMLLDGRCELEGAGRSRPFEKEKVPGVRVGIVCGYCCACEVWGEGGSI